MAISNELEPPHGIILTIKFTVVSSISWTNFIFRKMKWVIFIIIIHLGDVLTATPDKCICDKTEKIKIIFVKVKDKDLNHLNSDINIFETIDTNIGKNGRTDKAKVNKSNITEIHNIHNCTEDCKHLGNFRLNSLNNDVSPNMSISKNSDINLDGSENRRLNDDENILNTTRMYKILAVPNRINEIHNDMNNSTLINNSSVEHPKIVNNNITNYLPTVINNLKNPKNYIDIHTDQIVSVDSSMKLKEEIPNSENKENISTNINALTPGVKGDLNNLPIKTNTATMEHKIDLDHAKNQTNNKSDRVQNNIEINVETQQKLNFTKSDMQESNNNKTQNKIMKDITSVQLETTVPSKETSKLKNINNRIIIKNNINNESEINILPNSPVHIENTETTTPSIKSNKSEGFKFGTNASHKDFGIIDILKPIMIEKSKPILKENDTQNNLKESMVINKTNPQHLINLDNLARLLENQLKNNEDIVKNYPKDELTEMKNQTSIRYKDIVRGNVNSTLDLSSNTPNMLLEQIDTMPEPFIKNEISKNENKLNNSNSDENHKNNTEKQQRNNYLGANLNNNKNIGTDINDDISSNNIQDKNTTDQLERFNLIRKEKDNFEMAKNVSKSVNIYIPVSKKDFQITINPHRIWNSPDKNKKINTPNTYVNEPYITKLLETTTKNHFDDTNQQMENEMDNIKQTVTKLEDGINLNGPGDDNKIKLQDNTERFAPSNSIAKYNESRHFNEIPNIYFTNNIVFNRINTINYVTKNTY